MSSQHLSRRDDDWQQVLHDLRDALHAIQCGIDLLLEMCAEDAEQRRVLAIMRQDQESARQLVQRLADEARVPPR